MPTSSQNVSLSSLILTMASLAYAAPYELTVHSDEIASPGEIEQEYIFSVARPRADSQLPTRIGQMLVEVQYGVAKGWIVGIALPAVYSSQAQKLQGAALEAQYIAPHSKTGAWYWGVRGEISRFASLYEDHTALSLDINPILGYRDPNYRFTVNASVEKPLVGPDQAARFHPSAKFSKRITPQDGLGLEYHSHWGALSRPLAPRLRDETLYAVWDRQAPFGRWNVGLGRPLRPIAGSADSWVVKFGVQFETN